MYLQDFCSKFSYPDEAVTALTDAYGEVKANAEFNSFLDGFYTDETISVVDVENMLKTVSGETGANLYTVSLLYYILLSQQLKEKYADAGLSDDIFYASMDDLRCKLFECHTVYGVWGAFVSFWFYDFYRLKRFGIGRFQVELFEFDREDICVGGKLITKGQKLINCHIPSSGKPFDAAARRSSYKAAYEFFKPQVGEETAFVCYSWLLYPKNKLILDKGSNILSFMDDFTVISSKTLENGGDLWRIYGKMYDGNAAALPENTSLQRAYKKWLAAGNLSGIGFGIFPYDGKAF